MSNKQNNEGETIDECSNDDDDDIIIKMSNKQNNEGETIDECSSDDDDDGIIFDKNHNDNDNDNDKCDDKSDNVNIIDDKKYFLGFEESNQLRKLWQRLNVLEKWNELAIRPKSIGECHPDDRFLFSSSINNNSNNNNHDDDDDDDNFVDDLPALRKQCLLVRNLMNITISTLSIETTKWEKNLVVRTSQIPNAGMGLYYEIPVPSSSSLPSSSTKETTLKSPLAEDTTGDADADADADADDIQVFPDTIPEGSVLCFYTGHVHNHSSASRVDKSYMLWIRGDILVTAGNMPTTVTARYINDPLNDTLINCRFAVTSLPPDFDHEDEHEDTIRSSVVATRSIRLGEELFLAYGQGYWKNQQPHIKGEILNKINLI
jgi:hypothetical protein